MDCILLVDDDPDLLLNLQILLEYNGYDVIPATDGNVAYEFLTNEDKNVPDLIISDIIMPNIDGYKLYSKLSANNRFNQIPFIFLTAQATSVEINKGLSLDVEDYIIKPFKKEVLLNKIKNILDIREKEKKFSDNTAQIGDDIQEFIINLGQHNVNGQVFLVHVIWDDILGPKVEHVYPDFLDYIEEIGAIGVQLYKSSSAIYGNRTIQKPEGILISISNTPYQGYALFDSIPDNDKRSGHSEYMFAVISRTINYFQGRHLKQILWRASDILKKGDQLKHEHLWEEICEVLSEKPITNLD